MRIGWLLLVLLITPIAIADQVVVNSEDWRDVYSGLQYAAATGEEGFFVLDAQQGPRLIEQLAAGDQDILLVTGRDQAMPGFRSLLRSNGFTVEEITSRNPVQTNQDLALRAPTRNIIIVDDGYGYSALGVATYANVINASVLFADTGALDIIEEKAPEEVLIYGHIPVGLEEDLGPLATERINNQDRFENNFALVQRLVERSPSQSLLLTNGEFIETQLMIDDLPVLFTGRQNVPDEVIDLINEQGFRVAVLIGNSLAPNANYIKEETGLSIFIKFAQGRNEEQFALDLFPVPVPNPLITITQAEYDAARQSLLVTYQNPGEVATYFTASYETSEDTYEDAQPVFVDAGTHKTVSYEMPPPGESVEYTLLYGPYPSSLEYILQGSLDITEVTIDDRSEIALTEAFYDPAAEEFRITVENTGSVDSFVLLEAENVRIGADSVRLSGDVERVPTGSAVSIPLAAALSERDVERLSEIELVAYHGEREFSLVNRERVTLPVTVATGGFPLWAIGAAIILLVLAVFVLRKRR